MTADAKTPADRLAEAVRALKDAHDAADLDVYDWNGRMDYAWIAVSAALAAYDSRKKPTVEDVAKTIAACLKPFWSEYEWEACEYAARAAMLVMGCEVEG